MDETEVIQRFGLPPRADDLPVIREELAEATRLEAGDDDEGDTLVMKALCVLLFASGHVEDSLAIWRAKRASFDAGCSIDVQLLCGAGFDATLRYLGGVDSEDAREALAYILSCEATGDFAGHDAPGGRLSEMLPAYRRYYGVDATTAASD
jgi:hypothetical protein